MCLLRHKLQSDSQIWIEHRKKCSHTSIEEGISHVCSTAGETEKFTDEYLTLWPSNLFLEVKEIHLTYVYRLADNDEEECRFRRIEKQNAYNSCIPITIEKKLKSIKSFVEHR